MDNANLRARNRIETRLEAIDQEIGLLRGEIVELRLSEAQANQAAKGPIDGVVPLAELEKRMILRAVRLYSNDLLTAARVLGIGRTTLYRKLGEYGWISRRQYGSA